MTRSVLAILIACATMSPAETVAIVNARIFPVSGAPIEKGTLVIQDKLITAIGTAVRVPPGARRIDAAGLSVYPGWIDAWTQIGLSEISAVGPTVDTTEIGPFNPAAKAWIAVNPHSENVRTARVNGITTALVAPTGGLISGVASAINLLGKYPDEMLVLGDAAVVLNLPSPRRARPGPLNDRPDARDSDDARLRAVTEQTAKLKEYLREAKRYAEARARAGNDFPASQIDSALDSLLPVIRGERPVIFVADHFRDIRDAVQFGEEFGMKVVIAGGADAWKIADYLGQKKVSVLYSGVYELPRTAEEPYDASFAAPEILRRAGVPFAIVSASANDSRNVPYRAAMAAAYGLEREDAVKAITLWPAQILGIAGKVGSLETGKLANVLITKGDPLDIRSEVKYVFIEGKEVPPGNRNLDMYEEFRQPPAPAPSRRDTQ